MECKIKVSVIIPVYNVEAYIEECLRSVMAQTYTNYECVIVDDCGQDSSIKVAERMIDGYEGPASFRIIHREQNGGLSAARNSGIREAVGDYLYFLDSDDSIFPHTLAVLVALTEKYPGVDMVQGNCEKAPNGRWSPHYVADKFPEYIDNHVEASNTMLDLKYPITAWNRLIRSDFIRHNALCFSVGYIHEDIIWLWDIQKVIKTIAFAYIDTYWYRTDNSSSIMSLSDKSQSMICYLRIYEYLVKTLERNEEVPFAFSVFNPIRKMKYWDIVSDKKLVISQLNKSIIELRKVSVSYFWIFNLNVCKLPTWLLRSRILLKLLFFVSNRIEVIHR